MYHLCSLCTFTSRIYKIISNYNIRWAVYVLYFYLLTLVVCPWPSGSSASRWVRQSFIIRNPIFARSVQIADINCARHILVTAFRYGIEFDYRDRKISEDRKASFETSSDERYVLLINKITKKVNYLFNFFTETNSNVVLLFER